MVYEAIAPKGLYGCGLTVVRHSTGMTDIDCMDACIDTQANFLLVSMLHMDPVGSRNAYVLLYLLYIDYKTIHG